MQPEKETEIVNLLQENTTLVRENNVILKKLRRNSIIEMCLRVMWYAILIGLPFALYFYILEPYLMAFGSSTEKIRVGIGQLPGVKVFQSLFGGK